MAIAVLYDTNGSALGIVGNPLVMVHQSTGGFSHVSSSANLNTGTAVSGSDNPNGSFFYHNSAVLAGTSGGHSALMDIVHRPHASMPWQAYDVVITATQSLSGRVPLTAVAGQWASRILSAFSANGSAPRITTYFDFGS